MYLGRCSPPALGKGEDDDRAVPPMSVLPWSPPGIPRMATSGIGASIYAVGAKLHRPAKADPGPFDRVAWDPASRRLYPRASDERHRPKLKRLGP